MTVWQYSPIIAFMAQVDIELIEKIRKAKGLTQRELSSLLRISESHYCHIKKGRKFFTLDHIEALWRELNIPLHKMIIKKDV